MRYSSIRASYLHPYGMYDNYVYLFCQHAISCRTEHMRIDMFGPAHFRTDRRFWGIGYFIPPCSLVLFVYSYNKVIIKVWESYYELP